MIRELLDEKSSVSSMRLMSLIALFHACGLAAYGLYTGKDLIGLTALCSVFITAAFTGKVVQKSMENKPNA